MNNRRYWLAFLLIMIVGFVTRFYQLSSVPGNIHPDEADALRLFLEWRASPMGLSMWTPNWNGSHAVNNYLLTLPWELAGRPFWGMRIAPALISILTLVVFFLAVSRLVNKWQLALITTMLLAVDPWFLNFSRSSWENIANALMVALLLLAYALPRRRLWWSVGISMLVSVVSPYLYHPGKMVAVVGVMILANLLFIRYPQSVHKKLMVFSLCLVGVLIGVLPYLDHLSFQQLDRIQTVSVMS